MPEKNTDERLKALLSQRIESGLALADSKYKDLITESAIAYESAHQAKMPDMRKAILAYSMEQYATALIQRGVPQQYIKEASDNIADVQNPISMMFSMISLLVPNFAYMDACAVQPMPTETSPFFFQQLTANTARNGVASGTQLLGGTAWASGNDFTGNRRKESMVGSGSPWTLTAASKPLMPGKVKIWSADRTVLLKDNGVGGFTMVKGPLAAVFTLGAATVNYTTGAISIAASGTLASGTITGGVADYRYDMDAAGEDPAQVLYQWSTKSITAYPRRLRSVYALENYLAAKQVLKGVDIDSLLNTSMAGYLNKEISCGVFDNMYDEATGAVTWSKGLPTGVSWAFHRLSILQTLVEAANTTRKNIARGGGNVFVAGTTWMNYIETLGDDIWAPAKFSREPIGPYNAGTLAGKFTVIKNQSFADADAILAYKADDTDASYAVGVFIALYDTDSIALDDLKVRRGIGTSLGESLIFDNSITLCQVTA